MKKYLSIFIITVLAFGCTEEWLTLYPHTSIADEQAILTVADGRIAMNGVYRRMRDYQFYGRNIFVCADVGCEDVILRTDNSNRYVQEYRWTLQPGGVSSEIYTYAYSAIKRSNEVIERLSAVTPEAGQTEAAKNHIIGEAYFARALFHFELVKFFSQAYNFTSDASHMGVPYIVKSTMEVNHARLTVKECFDKIIADAEQAISLMNVDKPATPYTAGKNAVKALLARVYLYKACTSDGASFAKAAQYAEELIGAAYTIVNRTNYQITGSNTAFASPNMWGADFSTESIFVLPFSPTERMSTNSLGNIYLDKQKGYGDLKPSQQFRDLLSENDVRNSMIYFHDGAWCVRKFMGNGQAGGWDLSNLNIFRLSEMYLIAAEGNAKASTPNATKALQFLNTLRTNRGLAAVDLSGEALNNEIVRERRRELCFEGHSLPDHKRLNTSIVRTPDPVNPENQRFGLVYGEGNNKYFAMPIPDNEMNTNNLMVQNPGY